MQRELRFTGVLDTGKTVEYSESISAPDEQSMENMSTALLFRVGNAGMVEKQGDSKVFFGPHRFNHIKLEESSVMVVDVMPSKLR